MKISILLATHPTLPSAQALITPSFPYRTTLLYKSFNTTSPTCTTSISREIIETVRR